ncbi:9274_t:CDS:2 [Diversispora eburnea]|uniref:9274_t:CDS:1 n=1 Tax=Diversispora eburnea TaxID=1213867 RepID=A0A9N8VC15_9GLOM|nr:9274_t:CDS:2 [Diversispora eburnea]
MTTRPSSTQRPGFTVVVIDHSALPPPPPPPNCLVNYENFLGFFVNTYSNSSVTITEALSDTYYICEGNF